MKKTKKIKRISLLLGIMVPIFLVGIVLLIILLNKPDQEIPVLDTNNDQYRIQEISEINFLSNQKNSVTFMIELNSEYEESEQYFSIVNSIGSEVNSSLIFISGNTYEILPPENGYKPGGIYNLELEDRVCFADKQIKDNKITFSIEKPETLKYDLKDNIEISTIVSPGRLDNNLLIFDELLSESLFSLNSIALYPIIVDGFVTETYFNVQYISYENDKTICSGINPNLSDIFENLEIFKNVVLEEKDFLLLSEEEITQSLLDSDFVDDTINVIYKYQNEINPSEVYRKYNSTSTNNNLIDQYKDDMRNEINFEIEFEFEPNNIKINIEMSIENFIRIGNPVTTVINFYVDFEISIIFNSLVNIDIWAGEFAFGQHYYSTIGVKARVEIKGEFPMDSHDSELKYSQTLVNSFKNFVKSNSNSKDLSMNLGKGRIPTGVPALDLFISVKCINKLELSASIEAEFFSFSSSDTLLSRFDSEFKQVSSKTSKFQVDKIILSGKMEYKAGIKVEAGVTIAGIFDIGLSLEAGFYEEIGGIFTLVLGDLQNTKLPSFCVDAGLYYEVSFFYEIDLLFFTSRTSIKLAGEKFPLFHIGNSKIRTIPNPPTVTMLTELSSNIPSITINVFDFFDYSDSIEIITPSEFNKYFITKPGLYSSIKDNAIVINANSPEDFNDHIAIRYRSVVIGGSEGLISYEWGNAECEAEILVTKEPIAIKSISLSINPYTVDPNYEKIYQLKESTPYYLKTGSNSNDFQVSRLIKITVHVLPTNASYKTFDYIFTMGEDCIERILDNPIKVFENGEESYIFRVKDGNQYIGREINFQVISNGYVGKYESLNVSYFNINAIFPTSIPALKANLEQSQSSNLSKNAYRQLPNSLLGNICQVNPGTFLTINLDKNTLFPSNATRGILANEGFSFTSEYIIADDIQSNSIEQGIFFIRDDSPIDSQIILTYTLGDVISNFVIQVIKASLQSLELTSNSELINPNDSITLTTSFKRDFENIDVLSYIDFIVLSGESICTLAQGTSYLSIVVSLLPNANFQDQIEIIALSEGRMSNICSITVNKISVQSVELSTTDDLEINHSDIIHLSSIVFPANATISNVSYVIIEDNNNIGVINKNTGILEIRVNARFNDIIRVQAICDNIESNILTFTVPYTPIKYLYYQYQDIILKPGTSFSLIEHLVYNPDASNPIVNFILTEGIYMTITNNILILNDNILVEGYMVDSITLSTPDNLKLSFEFTIQIENYTYIPPLPENFFMFVPNNSNEIRPNEIIEIKINYSGTVIDPELYYAIYNTEIEYEIIGPAIIRDISIYRSQNHFYVTQEAKILVQANYDAKVNETIQIIAKYKNTSRLVTLNVFSAVEEIDTSSNKTIFYAGDEYQFTAIILPLNIQFTTYGFLVIDPWYKQYLDLSSDGYGVFNVSVLSFVSVTFDIIVYCESMNTRFQITLLNPIKNIEIGVTSVENNSDLGFQYIKDLDIYIIDSGTEIKLSVNYINLIPTNLKISHSYQVILNSVANNYFSFENDSLVFKIRNSSLPGGEYATIALISENVISNTLIFFIPISIRTLKDYQSISNNIFGYYAIYEDIDFQKSFFQIPEFHGILIGHNHLLKNLYLELEISHGTVALFNENYGIIKDLIIDDIDISITNSESANGLTLIGGVLCGKNYGLIDHCQFFDLRYSNITIEAKNMIFGIVSAINYGIINDSFSEVKVYFKGLLVGGIAGLNSSLDNITIGIISNSLDMSYFFMKTGDTEGVVGNNQGELFHSSFGGSIWY